jgi:hypothetical protein
MREIEIVGVPTLLLPVHEMATAAETGGVVPEMVAVIVPDWPAPAVVHVTTPAYMTVMFGFDDVNVTVEPAGAFVVIATSVNGAFAASAGTGLGWI